MENIPICSENCKNLKYCSVHKFGKVCEMWRLKTLGKNKNGAIYGAMKRSKKC